MITKNTVTLFTATDGSKHEDLDEAKLASVKKLLAEAKVLSFSDNELTAKHLLASAPQLLDILTTTPTSLPRARKANGGKKPRKSKQIEIPAEAYAPVKGDPSLGNTVAA